LREASGYAHDYGETVSGTVGKYRFERTVVDDYAQAGALYRAFDDRHRNDLVENLVDALKQTDAAIAERMVWHFLLADEDYGRRVGTGLGLDIEAVRKLPPLEGKPVPPKFRDGAVRSGDPTNGSSGDPKANGGTATLVRPMLSRAEATGLRG